MSRQMGSMGQWKHPVALKFRDFMMSMMMKLMPNANDWLYGYDCARQPAASPSPRP
jgi:hypothetical protein